MAARAGALRSTSALAVLASVLVGCAAGFAPSPTVPSQTPTTSPASAPFELDVIPADSVGRTTGGQRVVYLVTASGSSSDGPVELAAVADQASLSIEPQPLMPGIVGEISVVPAKVSEEVELAVGITGSRGAITRTVARTLSLVPGEDALVRDAEQHLAPFLAWLATHRPDLGIDDQTRWEATPGSWVLVVDHYLFFSEQWELDLSWHVMIQPDDWARISLRHRWTESHPSLAFEIASVGGRLEPREIEPPDDVWR
jgi:hypothetical protein